MAETQTNYGLDLFLTLGETRPARALESALREAIVAGRLQAGHRLPPTRGLAADLGIARATVSDVYAQLTAEGWLEARVGSGTWVAESTATGGMVIEDDYDGEFRFDRRSVGSLQGMAPDHAIYLGTASKALAPAIGLAWAVVPGRLLAGLLRQRDLYDRMNDSLNQLTLAEFFADHAYDRHVRRMRAEYRRRREQLVTELAARVPRARVLGVAAGLQATIELPPGTDPENVVAHGLRRGLEFETLAGYAAEPDKPHRPAIVLAYGASPASRARGHIELAVTAIEASLAE